MNLTFLGSGSAFTVGENNYHSNILLEANGEKLLIDCGSDCRFSLFENNLTHRDINHVFISHLHADHEGGLEWLAFTRKFDHDCEKPNLYICDTLAADLWDHVLSGGLSSVEGHVDLNSYFNVCLLHENKTFFWNGIDIKLIPTLHCMCGSKVMPTYGLFFSLNGSVIWITGDTKFIPDLQMEYYKKADIIFHDCETNEERTNVHSHYEDLLTLPKEIKKKIWLYHFNPGSLPDAIQGGFQGFVQKGQVFYF
jgi:ribonuclease BN (tRNA processing enzyme)